MQTVIGQHRPDKIIKTKSMSNKSNPQTLKDEFRQSNEKNIQEEEVET